VDFAGYAERVALRFCTAVGRRDGLSARKEALVSVRRGTRSACDPTPRLEQLLPLLNEGM
jgi:hypothetical protein